MLILRVRFVLVWSYILLALKSKENITSVQRRLG